MNSRSVVSLKQARHSCEGCTVPGLCLADNLLDHSPGEGRAKLGSIIHQHRLLNRAEYLFIAGDRFTALYIICSGSAKSYVLSESGEQQITGFHFPGDLIGIDGFDTGRHAYSLEFLETSSVCRVGLAELDKLLAESSVLRSCVLKVMSHALIEEQRLLLSLGKLNAEQRLAGFLLDLSVRFKHRGVSEHAFNLSMSRNDIANYLGLVVETISRTLSKFQRLGLIDVQRRRIQILQADKLKSCVDADDGEDWMSVSPETPILPSQAVLDPPT